MPNIFPLFIHNVINVLHSSSSTFSVAVHNFLPLLFLEREIQDEELKTEWSALATSPVISIISGHISGHHVKFLQVSIHFPLLLFEFPGMDISVFGGETTPWYAEVRKRKKQVI